jgi:hypothetical protein
VRNVYVVFFESGNGRYLDGVYTSFRSAQDRRTLLETAPIKAYVVEVSLNTGKALSLDALMQKGACRCSPIQWG